MELRRGGAGKRLDERNGNVYTGLNECRLWSRTSEQRELPEWAGGHYQWENNTEDFRLKEIQNLGAGGAVQKNTGTNAVIKVYGYSYDAAGNRASLQEGGSFRSSSYNNLNQLLSSAAGGVTRFQGTLNEPGNVTVNETGAQMSGGTGFTTLVNLYVGTNSVPVVAKDASNNTWTNTYQVVVPSGGTRSYSYDANGNMLSDGSNSYTWDARNRLVKIEYASGASSEFAYDIFDRRIQMVEKDASNAVTNTKRLVWDGLSIAEQRDASNAVQKRYYADGWKDEVANASYFLTKDHLGSTREVTDGSGALAARYDYDPYGQVTKLTGSVDSDMLYTGHYYHAPSGLFLAPYRAYDPALGRWISRDPIGEEGGINLYNYVANSTPNFCDPTGLFIWSANASGGRASITTTSGMKYSASSAADLVTLLNNIADSDQKVENLTITGHASPTIQTLGDNIITVVDLPGERVAIMDDLGDDITFLLNRVMASGSTIKFGGCHSAHQTADGGESLAQRVSRAIPAANVVGYNGIGFGLSSIGSVGVSRTYKAGKRQ